MAIPRPRHVRKTTLAETERAPLPLPPKPASTDEGRSILIWAPRCGSTPHGTNCSRGGSVAAGIRNLVGKDAEVGPVVDDSRRGRAGHRNFWDIGGTSTDSMTATAAPLLIQCAHGILGAAAYCLAYSVVGAAAHQGCCHRACQQDGPNGLGNDDQGRALQGTRRTRDVKEIASGIRRDVTVGKGEQHVMQSRSIRRSGQPLGKRIVECVLLTGT